MFPELHVSAYKGISVNCFEQSRLSDAAEALEYDFSPAQLSRQRRQNCAAVISTSAESSDNICFVAPLECLNQNCGDDFIGSFDSFKIFEHSFNKSLLFSPTAGCYTRRCSHKPRSGRRISPAQSLLGLYFTQHFSDVKLVISS